MKAKTEKLIYDIFRLCDKTVWIDDWKDFHKSFDKIVKKFGYDLNSIYFNKKKVFKKNKNKRKELFKKMGD